MDDDPVLSGDSSVRKSALKAVLRALDIRALRLRNDPELSAACEKGLDNGRSSIRRIQWKPALSGNTSMQIWLGKQYLGQRDVHHTELTGAKGEALIPAPLVVHLDAPTRTLLRELRGRLATPLAALLAPSGTEEGSES